MTWMTLISPIRYLGAPSVGLVLLTLATAASVAPVSSNAQDRPVRDPFATGAAAGGSTPAAPAAPLAPTPDPFGSPPTRASYAQLAAERAAAEAAAMGARAEPEATTLVTEMVEVPADALVRHLAESGLELDDAKLREEVDALLASGEAERLSVEAITVSGPLGASLGSYQSVIYPTEFTHATGVPYPAAFETRNAGIGLYVRDLAPNPGGLGLRFSRDSVELIAGADLSLDGENPEPLEARYPIFDKHEMSQDWQLLEPGAPVLVDVSAPLHRAGVPSDTRRRLLFLTATRLANPGAAPNPPNRRALTLFSVEVDWETLNAWTTEHGVEEVGSGLWLAAERWLSEESARLVDADVFRPVHGGGSKSESVREHIFPTEYDPPPTRDAPSPPVAFETMPVGSQSEVSFSPPDVAVPFVELDLAFDSYEGESLYRFYKEGEEILPAISQPLFAAAKLETRIDLGVLTGQPVLLGLIPSSRSVDDDEPHRKWVVLFGKLTP